MSNLTPDAATEQEVRQLLKRLARLKRKWPSEPALRDLSPQMVEGLQAYANRFVQSTGYIQLVMGALMLFYFIGKDIEAPGFLLTPAFICLVVGIALWFLRERQRWLCIYALTQTEDLRVLPTLIIATLDRSRTRNGLVQAITRLLPQVTEAHVGLLDREAQERLWYFAVAPIRYESGDEALAVSALRTLARIGNREMLTKMRYFARSNTSYAAYSRVNVLINQLTPIMTARLQRQEVPATLLRPSDTPTAYSEILVRPATSAIAESAEQLLRAANSETSEDAW